MGHANRCHRTDQNSSRAHGCPNLRWPV